MDKKMLLVLAVGGVAAWYFLLRPKPSYRTITSVAPGQPGWKPVGVLPLGPIAQPPPQPAYMTPFAQASLFAPSLVPQAPVQVPLRA